MVCAFFSLPFISQIWTDCLLAEMTLWSFETELYFNKQINKAWK